ncbi:hypothetical protein GCM10027347_52340 [Larkinella harenae]
MKKRLKDLTVSEIVDLYNFASDMANSYADAAEKAQSGSGIHSFQIQANKWESYGNELESHLEERIKYALDREDNKPPAFI